MELNKKEFRQGAIMVLGDMEKQLMGVQKDCKLIGHLKCENQVLINRCVGLRAMIKGDVFGILYTAERQACAILSNQIDAHLSEVRIWVITGGMNSVAQ